MKVQHKNSKEIFDISSPKYTKLFGSYGYLVMGLNSVFFIIDSDENLDNSMEVTDDFEILIQ